MMGCCNGCKHYGYKIIDPPCNVGARFMLGVSGTCLVRTLEERINKLEANLVAEQERCTNNLIVMDAMVLVDVEYWKRAELFGSRGRARWRGEPEPEDADWDFIVFTDDPALLQWLFSSLTAVGEVKGSQLEFWVRVSGDVDLNVMPVAHRKKLLAAYAFQDATGCSKEEMIEFLKGMKHVDRTV